MDAAGEVSAAESACPNETRDQTPRLPSEVLPEFYQLQQERVEAYQLFENGFQAYLAGAPNYNFTMYKELVHEITNGFNGISQSILNIVRELEANEKYAAIVTKLQKVQELEAEKLSQTVQQQLLRKSVQDEPTNEDHPEDLQQVKNKLSELLSEIIEALEDLKYESEEWLTI